MQLSANTPKITVPDEPLLSHVSVNYIIATAGVSRREYAEAWRAKLSPNCPPIGAAMVDLGMPR